MKWYDIVAPLYDRAISRTYLPYRRLAVQALHLQPGLTVIDLGCGTGLSFELIRDAIGPQGTLIGIDSSTKMLNRAQKKIDRQGWSNVHLLNLDAFRLTRHHLEALTGRRVIVGSLICTLGFSVFPDWQAVFENSFNLLESGGRYCVMDIFNDAVSLRTRIVRILANSDNSRRIWEPLKKKCANYLEERYPMPHGDIVVIASGIKS
jgi:demethylmenaquinone methyltransferase/2-methoxy-6-polyprenyl-1,4-benzoquinol methylase